MSANQGNAVSQYSIGHMHTTGKGMAWNMQKALKWTQLAAAQNDPRAIAHLKDVMQPNNMIVQPPVGADVTIVLMAGKSVLHADRSTEVTPQGVLHGEVADIFYTDVRSILMVLLRVSKASQRI